MPSTATLHIAEVGGYQKTYPGAAARCYALDPPKVLGGKTHRYVTILITERLGGIRPEVRMYPARADGSAAEPQLNRMAGSWTVPEDVELGTREAEDYCHWVGLTLLGGYELTR